MLFKFAIWRAALLRRTFCVQQQNNAEKQHNAIQFSHKAKSGYYISRTPTITYKRFVACQNNEELFRPPLNSEFDVLLPFNLLFSPEFYGSVV